MGKVWGVFWGFFYCGPLLCTTIIAVLGHICVRCTDHKNPWAWYSHIIPLMIKMSNHNITQRGIQETGLGVMIGRCNPSQRGYRKIMIEMWQERSTFQTTSQRLADEVRTIMKKGLFSSLELQEIHKKHWNKTITQCQTHQVVSNKNNPTKKNRKPRQMKTPHSQTIHYQTTRKKLYHKNKR